MDTKPVRQIITITVEKQGNVVRIIDRRQSPPNVLEFDAVLARGIGHSLMHFGEAMIEAQREAGEPIQSWPVGVYYTVEAKDLDMPTITDADAARAIFDAPGPMEDYSFKDNPPWEMLTPLLGASGREHWCYWYAAHQDGRILHCFRHDMHKGTVHLDRHGGMWRFAGGGEHGWHYIPMDREEALREIDLGARGDRL